MTNLTWAWLLLISVFQVAQSAPTRTVWRTPSGNNKDFVTTYYIGSTVTIDWSGWDSSVLNRDMNGVSKADLWVNAWNTDFSTWSKKISTSTIDVSYSGTFNWKVTIDEKALSDTKEYGFTFKPTGESFAPSNPRLYSPGFHLNSNETTSTSTSANSSIQTSLSTATITQTPEAASSDTGGLPTGAKAGIGVGASVAGLVLSAFGFLLFRRRQQSLPQEMTGNQDQATDGSSYMKAKPAPQELLAPPPEMEPTTNTRREMM